MFNTQFLELLGHTADLQRIFHIAKADKDIFFYIIITYYVTVNFKLLFVLN